MAIYDLIEFRRVVETPDGATVLRNGYGVSANFFRVLGVEPALGRTFLPAEDRPDAAVVVISHSLWERDLASDANAIGKTLIVDGGRRTIVGIMRPEFRYYMPPGMSSDAPEIDLFVPYAFAHTSPTNRQYYINAVIARLKPGATLQAASVEMNAIRTPARQSSPRGESGFRCLHCPARFRIGRQPILALAGLGNHVNSAPHLLCQCERFDSGPNGSEESRNGHSPRNRR
jgi:putative ABC transport system permease protein